MPEVSTGVGGWDATGGSVAKTVTGKPESAPLWSVNGYGPAVPRTLRTPGRSRRVIAEGGAVESSRCGPVKTEHG